MEKFDICFFMTGDTQIFKLVILLILSSSTLIFIPLTLGKLKLTLFVLFYYFGQVIVISLCLGKTYHKKQFKPSKFDKNSRTKRRIWHFRVRTSDLRIAICRSNLSMSICGSLQQFTIQTFLLLEFLSSGKPQSFYLHFKLNKSIISYSKQC